MRVETVLPVLGHIDRWRAPYLGALIFLGWSAFAWFVVTGWAR